MQRHAIPHSDLEVSSLCLGTMTFGEQNSEAEAHSQLDRALACGINFIDTAEMYPVPPRRETQGRTEDYIGSWLAAGAPRDRIVLATKVAAPGGPQVATRDDMRLTAINVRNAVDNSLRRLQTDYIDLYQIHWPERSTNYFGQLGFTAADDSEATPIFETLSVLGDLVAEGKIRYIGLSNETPWGVAEYLKLSERHQLPRPITIQNPYSLLNRTFEVGLAEFAHREGVKLLAYSPLGFGILTGKYEGGARPAGARLTLFSRFQRYFTEQGLLATSAYVQLARDHGLSPAQMALAFCLSRPFMASTIIGATTLSQLDENIAATATTLSDELLQAIEAIHRRHPNPCP
ncbi:MAG: NADP(H)-dependent aldo-keto reductase [Gammaproteobacteria bacterium]|nr:NADP(H)-dependent aldo-keto reductase [Gammaproteobacteria bacterium]